MSKELEAFRDILGILSAVSGCEVDMNSERVKIVEQALQRLEQIDNTNPSEALECLEVIEQDIKDRVILAEDRQIKLCAVIKRALLKAQEPKHYLKWEDLEFKHTPKVFDVKMGDNKYKLVVGHNVAGHTLTILRTYEQQYYFLEADKQIFNDLHLERVEE